MLQPLSITSAIHIQWGTSPSNVPVFTFRIIKDLYLMAWIDFKTKLNWWWACIKILSVSVEFDHGSVCFDVCSLPAIQAFFIEQYSIIFSTQLKRFSKPFNKDANNARNQQKRCVLCWKHEQLCSRLTENEQVRTNLYNSIHRVHTTRGELLLLRKVRPASNSLNMRSRPEAIDSASAHLSLSAARSIALGAAAMLRSVTVRQQLFVFAVSTRFIFISPSTPNQHAERMIVGEIYQPLISITPALYGIIFQRSSFQKTDNFASWQRWGGAKPHKSYREV